MITIDHREVLGRILERLGSEALARARLACPSMTLREAMRVVIIDEQRIKVYVPHYWAVYYHDGRGTVQSGDITGRSNKTNLVYFRDIKDDPRLSGGFPERAEDIRELSPNEWLFWLKQNQLAREQGLPEPMVVTKTVGPTEPHPFFTEGLRNFIQIARVIVLEEFDRWVRGIVFRTSQRSRAHIRLR